MAVETKAVIGVEFKAGARGTFVAEIGLLNVADRVRDVLRRGAIAETKRVLEETGEKIPVIYSHMHSEPRLHVGEVDELRETDRGIEASGHFYLDEPDAAKVFKQLQRKTLTQWSFGFMVREGGAKRLPNGDRELNAIDLVEIGPCLRGIGHTATLAVKSGELPPTRAPRPSLAPYQRTLDLAVRRAAIVRALARQG